ncbi:MAG: TonB-dependent receptor, partial [Kangiellaceae bacterium]|nr:TonB-dependent receptor [Kangiellaceae bacterium]
YRSRAAAQIGDLPRVNQIEVMSGPQSTLFGKNASAGVINVRTKVPSYESEGKIEVGFGNFNQQSYKAYYTNGISDNVAFSLSGSLATRDGYTKSLIGTSKLNDRDRWSLRGQLLWEPTDDVVIRLIADQSEVDEICCTVANFVNGPTTGILQLLGATVLSDQDHFSYESALNKAPTNKVTDKGVSLQADVNFDGFDFTSITALRSNDSADAFDADFSAVDFLSDSNTANIDTFTQEFRLTSTGENKLDWMIGTFFFTEDVDTGTSLDFGPGTRPFFDILAAGAGAAGGLGAVEPLYGLAPGSFFSADTNVSSDYTQKNDAYSVFATADYHFTDELTATFGLSYTNDEKDVTVTTTNTDALSNIDLGNDLTVFGVPIGLTPAAPLIPLLSAFQFLQPMLTFPNAVESGKSSDDQITYSIRLAYELNENVNVFATTSTGFKATSWDLGRNGLPFAADQAALATAGVSRGDQTFGTRFAKPEDSEVFEIGIKTRFEKGAFNITIFDQTIENFQSSIFAGTAFVLSNAGQQNTKGLEFDAVYRPTENWTLTLAGSLLDPVFDSFVQGAGVVGVDSPSGAIDQTGERPTGVHEQSIVAGIKYNFDLANGTYAYIRSDYIYESKVRTVRNVPADLTREVSTVNASAGLNFLNGVNLQLWVRNLNKDEYFQSAFPAPVQGGSFLAYPNQPRTFGASVSYEF